MAPRQLHHYEAGADLLDLSVRLMRAVGKNHPFEQGNKRTAFNGAIALLFVNGVRIGLPDSEEAAERVVKLLVGESSEAEMAAFLRPFCSQAPAS